MAALFRRKRLKGEFAYKFAPVHALREQGTRTNPSEEENKKRTAEAIRFLLAPPAGLEPWRHYFGAGASKANWNGDTLS